MKIYEDHKLKENKIPAIFHNTRTYTSNYKTILSAVANWHENIEILQIYEGKGLVVSNEEYIYVEQGDIAVINCNHLHYCIARSNNFSYRCLIIDRNFCISNGFDSNLIQFKNHFIDKKIDEHMLFLSQIWKAPDTTNLKTLQIKSRIIQIMERLCVHHRVENSYLKSDADSNALASVKNAIEFINMSYNKDISLTDVADHVGINQYYMAHIFKDITGTTFLSYLTRIRCEEARKLLRSTSLSISEISKNCGFNNPSYFSKRFKDLYNMLPNQYRNMSIAKKITPPQL